MQNSFIVDAPNYLENKEFIIVEGLLGYHSKAMRDCYDVKLYLAPPEELRYQWKMKRDTAKRGHSPEAARSPPRRHRRRPSG